MQGMREARLEDVQTSIFLRQVPINSADIACLVEMPDVIQKIGIFLCQPAGIVPVNISALFCRNNNVTFCRIVSIQTDHTDTMQTREQT